MKKLYRKSMVHPTASVFSQKFLSLLPAAILTLTAALTPADREILAYLISCSITQRHTTDDHEEACFYCNCFSCYMIYWQKWDSSPNRHLIHEAIDAFEESSEGKSCTLNEPTCSEFIFIEEEEEEEEEDDFVFCEPDMENFPEHHIKKRSLTRFARFLGQRIWSVLGS